MKALKAPFPAFGGKSRVAGLVWGRLGDVDNYIEPFAFSAAVLWTRPHAPRIETINDVNCYVSNLWRATQRDPEAVVAHCDWPVNEADLHARHRWLVLSPEAADFRERMRTDPDYFDAKIAGWWVWGACCWIGGGWCTANNLHDRKPKTGGGHLQYGNGVHNQGPGQKRPMLSGDNPGKYGVGIHAGGPSIPDEPIIWSGRGNGTGANTRRGINAQAGPPQRIPTMEQCQTGGKGVNGVADGRPQLADAFSRGRGVHGNDDAGTCAERRAWLLEWFGRLRDRLRTVRVCCGDWLRVCNSTSVTTRLGLTGLFLDPPYPTKRGDGSASRNGKLYASDQAGGKTPEQLRDEVLAYCLARGGDPLMRIAVCGYDTDGYTELEKHGWTCLAWKAQGGYGNRSARGKANAGRERIWFSPWCLKGGE